MKNNVWNINKIAKKQTKSSYPADVEFFRRSTISSRTVMFVSWRKLTEVFSLVTLSTSLSHFFLLHFFLMLSLLFLRCRYMSLMLEKTLSNLA